MSRLPALGRRGEGWLAIQIVLFWAVLATGLLGPAWAGTVRLATSAVGIALILGGLGLTARGIFDLGAARTPMPHPRPDAELVQTGVYRLVRHPIYGGLIVAAFGWGLLTASLVTVALAAVLLLFFELKSRREEAWLVERFPDYAAYRARTRRFIPWFG
jgi:protein-S-isoprenylcysteine O-methyltransferase Ste14